MICNTLIPGDFSPDLGASSLRGAGWLGLFSPEAHPAAAATLAGLLRGDHRTLWMPLADAPESARRVVLRRAPEGDPDEIAVEIEGDRGTPDHDARATVDALPTLVWRSDTAGRCLWLSAAWERFTGASVETLLGAGWLSRLHPDDHATAAEVWRAAARTEAPIDTEFRLLGRDGRYRWFKTRAHPRRDASGRVDAWLGSNTDIDDLRSAQTEAHARNRALEATILEHSEEIQSAQQKLQTLAIQLTHAQRLTQVGSWELDLDTGRVLWSDELFRIFALPIAPDAPHFSTHGALFEASSWARLQAAIVETRETGHGYNETVTLRTSDGTRRTARAIGERVCDALGRPRSLVGTFQDISAHAEAQTQLKTLSERLRLAASGARFGVWDFDPSTGALVWDETMFELYEVDPATFGGAYLDWTRCVHPDDLAEAEAALRRATEGPVDFDHGFRIVCPSGTKHLAAATAIDRNAQGVATRMVGVNYDVSAQRLAEQALAASEALGRAILGSVGAAIVATDLDGRITRSNPAAEQLLGPDAVAPGEPLLGLFDPAELAARGDDLRDPAAPASALAVALGRATEGGVEAREWSLLRRDASTVPALVTTSGLRLRDDQQTGYLAVMVDLTPQREQARALVTLNGLLADRSKQREVLLREVHHRVKNNLQVIASLVNLQLRRLVDSEAREALHETQRRIQSIALIHETLHQSRDDANVPFGEYAASLANAVFASLVTVPSSVRLELALCGLSLPVDRAIPCGLILNELITNALKHAFPDGRGGWVRVGLSREGREVTLSVADNGVGVERREPGPIATLGSQLITGLVRQIEGTLAVSRGQGTTATVTFHLAERSS